MTAGGGGGGVWGRIRNDLRLVDDSQSVGDWFCTVWDMKRTNIFVLFFTFCSLSLFGCD
jgi:hypothetical protein